MNHLLRILFGLVLGATGIMVALYLGLLLNGRQPDLKTGIGALLILAITQWASFLSFRRHIALQVLFGAVLCIAIAIGFLYSSIPIFWDPEDEPLVYAITWRSTVAFLLLLAITQGISYLVFHAIRKGCRNPHSEPTAS